MKVVLITMVDLAFVFVFLSDTAPQRTLGEGDGIETDPSCKLYTCI